MDRKAYWNEMDYQYWKERVEETKDNSTISGIVEGDAKTEGDEIYIEIINKNPFLPGNILEIGCAWGRWFYLYKEYNLKIYGIDISSVMIQEAKKDWGEDPGVMQLEEAEAEALPFEGNLFNNISCFAVFDATYQNKALSEMFRVSKTGGMIYLTGKNDNYFSDDQLALNAEIGARKKEHPNYFTDVRAMIDQIHQNGHSVISSYFFPRRGDFAELEFQDSLPTHFYEYLLILKKGGENYHFAPFSDEFSKTFKHKEKQVL